MALRAAASYRIVWLRFTAVPPCPFPFYDTKYPQERSWTKPLITVLTGVLTDVLADVLLSSFPPSARHALVCLCLCLICVVSCLVTGLASWCVLVCRHILAHWYARYCSFQAFAHVQWETLYRRFMDSPNFKPWFTTQRTEAVERIR